MLVERMLHEATFHGAWSQRCLVSNTRLHGWFELDRPQWVGGRVDGWVDGRMDGWMDVGLGGWLAVWVRVWMLG